jgi:hypothetical protein
LTFVSCSLHHFHLDVICDFEFDLISLSIFISLGLFLGPDPP